MANRDEEIIAAKRAAMEQKMAANEKAELEEEMKESIRDGRIHIFGKEVVFVRREFEEYGISILMPEIFVEAPDDLKTSIYPYGKAPKHVFMGDEIPFHLALNKTENIVPNEGIPKFLGIAKGVMERIGPKARILSTEARKKGEHYIGVLKMSTMGLDGAVFNLQCYVSLEDQKIELFALTCPASKYTRLISVMDEMVESIAFLQDEQQQEELTNGTTDLIE